MYWKVSCLENAEMTLKNGNLSEMMNAIGNLCTDVFRYRKLYSYQSSHLINTAVPSLSFDFKRGKVISCKSDMKLVCGSFYYHYFRTGGIYDGSGLIVQTKYCNPLPSFLQRLGMVKNGFRNGKMECYVYGREWEGEEIPTPTTFRNFVDVRTPKVKPKEIEGIIKEQWDTLEEQLMIKSLKVDLKLLKILQAVKLC
jgi:hypothetical protein